MGEHPRPGTQRNYKYQTLLRLSDDRPVTIYTDMSDGLRSIMIPKNLNNISKVKTPVILPRPTSPFPIWGSESFCFSKATLNGVSQLRICRKEEQITGMLLGYTNGTWASLGGIDLDRLERPMEVDTSGLWIQSAYTEGPSWVATRAHIVGIKLCAPHLEPENYLHIRWHGELEWWHSHRQNEVHYGGKQTAPIIM